MATQKIDNHIEEGTITIDNINSYYETTLNAINSVQNNDIEEYEQAINNLQNVLNNQMRVISENSPANPKKGSAWFHITS